MSAVDTSTVADSGVSPRTSDKDEAANGHAVLNSAATKALLAGQTLLRAELRSLSNGMWHIQDEIKGMRDDMRQKAFGLPRLRNNIPVSEHSLPRAASNTWQSFGYDDSGGAPNSSPIWDTHMSDGADGLASIHQEMPSKRPSKVRLPAFQSSTDGEQYTNSAHLHRSNSPGWADGLASRNAAPPSQARITVSGKLETAQTVRIVQHNLRVRDELLSDMQEYQDLLDSDGKLDRSEAGIALEPDDSDNEAGEAGGARNRKRWLMLEPTSRNRLAMDLLSLLVLFYDLCVTPFLIAWDVSVANARWVLVGTYLTTCFWSLDIVLTFRTGFYSDGQLEMNPWRVALRYFRSFFFLDLAVLATDILGLMSSVFTGSPDMVGSELLRFAKAGRMLRLLGVLRVSRMGEVFGRIALRHPGVGIAWSICQLLAVIVYINHMIACLWFYVGMNIPSDTGLHWVDEPDIVTGERTYRELPELYQYVTAFHFSLTQMTPGSMQVFPVNSVERIFNSSCLLFGLMTFGTLISSLSAMMVDLQKKAEETEKRLTVFRRFLRISGVRRRLSIRLEHTLQWRLGVLRPLTIHDVDALKFLPAKERSDLEVALVKQEVLRIPILRVCYRVDHALLRKICQEAIEFAYVDGGNPVFDSGKDASGCYYIMKGSGRYTLDLIPNTAFGRGPSATNIEEVEAEQWIAEPALWCHWRHVGLLVPNGGGCQIIQLVADGFAAVMKHRKLIRDVISAYASTFVRQLERGGLLAPTSNQDGPSDLQKSYEHLASYDQVVLALDLDYPALRIYLGLIAMHMAKESESVARNGSTPFNLVFTTNSARIGTSLETEVRSGKSNLVVDKTGQVQRVVRVACMKLVRADCGKFLVHLGKVLDGEVKAYVYLPGCKMKEGEIVAQALEPLFSCGELRMFEGNLTWRQEVLQEEKRWSSEHCVHTKYIKHVQHAVVHDEDLLADIPFTYPVLGGTVPGIGDGYVSTNVQRSTSIPVTLEPFFTMPAEDGPAGVFISTWMTDKEFEVCQADKERMSIQKYLDDLPIHDALVRMRECQSLTVMEIEDSSSSCGIDSNGAELPSTFV